MPRTKLSSAILSATLLFVGTAQASFIVNMTQAGTNVVAIGSGSIDTAGLTLYDDGDSTAGVDGSLGQIVVGTAAFELNTLFSGEAGPANFGSGGVFFASSGSGDTVMINGKVFLGVPSGNTSGVPLAGTATWKNQTFATLGLTPGTYVWSWGSGATADSFTVNILSSSAAEPDLRPVFALGLASLFVCNYRVKRRRQPAHH